MRRAFAAGTRVRLRYGCGAASFAWSPWLYRACSRRGRVGGFMNIQGVPAQRCRRQFYARAERDGRRDSRGEACIRAARLAPDGQRVFVKHGRGGLCTRPVPEGRPPEDKATAAVPPAAAGRACEARCPQGQPKRRL